MLQLKAQYKHDKGSYAPLEKLQQIQQENQKTKTLYQHYEYILSRLAAERGELIKPYISTF